MQSINGIYYPDFGCCVLLKSFMCDLFYMDVFNKTSPILNFVCVFSDDSLRYEYPFTLKAVQKDGFTCASCPWYRWVIGYQDESAAG